MFNSLGFLDIGTPELILILVIILLLFGGRKLPQLSRSLGESVRELRTGLGGENEEQNNTKTTKKPAAKSK